MLNSASFAAWSRTPREVALRIEESTRELEGDLRIDVARRVQKSRAVEKMASSASSLDDYADRLLPQALGALQDYGTTLARNSADLPIPRAPHSSMSCAA